MSGLSIVVLGTAAGNPYAGMVWMHMQLVLGLRRLGHDAFYFEITSNWPFDPKRNAKVEDVDYAVPFLARVAEGFGLANRWAFRSSFSDCRWFGLEAGAAEARLAEADLVLNVTGGTRVSKEGLATGRLVYYGTDPVWHEVTYSANDVDTKTLIDQHQDVVTFGENIGTAGCRIPPLPRLRCHTRPPVVMELWDAAAPRRDVFTTVGNWRQSERDVTLDGEQYRWSKHHEFEKFVDVPARTGVHVELATNLQDPETIRHGLNEAVPSGGMTPDERRRMSAGGWTVVESRGFSTDPWAYRRYITDSRGEFTVARDLNVRLASGWFSERSACYLAAGRPVVTQDTGFSTAVPTGEGLFAFSTPEQAVAALEEVQADYDRHSRAARDLAAEYFRAEVVLARLLEDLGA